MIEKWNLDKAYYELIFNHSLNGWSRNRSQAEDVLKFMINKKLDRKYFEIFIDQVLKIKYRDQYSKLECLIKLAKTACLEWNIAFDDYQNTMLRFLDISNPSKDETVEIIKMFLEHNREAEVYKWILMKIIVDKKLLTYLYFTDTLAALYKKTNDKMWRNYRCEKIIDTCVDDYLEWTHLEMWKIHIKIALDAMKRQEKWNEHRDYRSYKLTYKKIKEAWIQLLISE